MTADLHTNYIFDIISTIMKNKLMCVQADRFS